MNNWFLRGLRAGVRTEGIPPADATVAAGLSQGMPQITIYASENVAAEVAARCPTDALVRDDMTVSVVADRCVACMRCKEGHASPGQRWRHDTSWAHRAKGHNSEPLAGRFARSIQVRIIDAGDCGACLNEIAQMNGPSYNLHRFGIFVTPTPRQADVLLIVGPVTRQMIDPLRAAYEAMPSPKRVVAVGVCAASGGVFGPSLMCSAGAADVVPVDVVVAGCPPPPLAIVHALRAVCSQEPSA
jgi:Ni,Fe-hydrogenase III small subunit